MVAWYLVPIGLQRRLLRLGLTMLSPEACSRSTHDWNDHISPIIHHFVCARNPPEILFAVIRPSQTLTNGKKHSLRQFKRFFNAVTSTGEQYIGLLRLAVLPTDLRLNVLSWTFLDLTRFIFYIFQLKFILSWLSGLHESFYLVPFTGDGPP